jgi:hypothetical protein
MLSKDLLVVLSLLLLSTQCVHLRNPRCIYSQNPGDIHLSLQDDTVFGNYTSDGTLAYYTTCSPSVFIDVYDPDGVDSVWFTYRRSNETEPLVEFMESLPPGESRTYVGRFEANVSQSETEFIVQFHANDTLGHQSLTDEFSLVVFYSSPDPTGNGGLDALLISVSAVVVLVLLGIMYASRRESEHRGVSDRHPVSIT